MKWTHLLVAGAGGDAALLRRRRQCEESGREVGLPPGLGYEYGSAQLI